MDHDLLDVRKRVRRSLWLNPASSLTQITRELGVDRHVVEDAFRSVGTTFRETRNDIRFAYATRAFRTSLPLKAIAADLGYKSTRSFSRFISRRTGALPSALRMKK